MSTGTPPAQSLEERILYLLAPFRPPFVYTKPTLSSASVDDQLAEQRKAKVLAQNIAFLIRDGERGAKVTAEDVFVTTWGFQAWAEGSQGAALAFLVRESGKTNKILSVPLFPGENAVDKLFGEVESGLEMAFLAIAKRTNGV